MSKEPREFRMLREENSNRALLFSDCDVDAVAYPLFREVLPDQTGICPACATEFDLEEFTKCKSIIIEDLITLTAKVKRYEDAMVHIHKMGCAYKGNLTGCPACYICNEFPEFNEMNKRDRSEHGNN